MENNDPWQSSSSIAPSERIRNLLAGHALADDDGAIWIVAATAQNWPELAYVSIGEVALGNDGLIRFALWSASKCCATLLGTRRAALLLPEGDNTWEIRCLVIANASLTTARPLCGFLLNPVEILDRRASRSAPCIRGARHALEDIEIHADQSRLALFEAFPVNNDGENASPGGVLPPRRT
jgi:hypothetical protein